MSGQTAKQIILAVDDMPLNLAVMRNVLSNDYDLRPVKSAAAALRMLGTIRPDLILLDIEMPEMSGFEFLAQMRNNPEHPEYKTIPVVFVTAHATEEFAARAMSAGACGYVVKPIEPPALLQKIRSLFSGKRSSGRD
jgi:CheY-like chemotaxis protein